MKRKIFKIVLLLTVFILPLGASAAALKTDNNVYVEKGQVVSGNLYALGQTVTIDGDISGDLIAVGQTINVNGRVDGDILAAAQNLTVNGEVGGNIRVLGNSLNLNGPVARNVDALGASVVLGDRAKVGWDLSLAAGAAEIRGEIDGSLVGASGRVIITGTVDKNVDLKMGGKKLSQDLTVASGAKIGGDLIYTAQKEAQIADRSAIGGQVQQKLPAAPAGGWFLAWLWKKLVAIFSALVVGLILVFLLKKITPKILDIIATGPGRSLLLGLLVMFVLPPIAFLLILTIIGLPLALIIMAWWLVATYVARVIAAILLGRLILRGIFKRENPNLFWSLVLGAIILWLLSALPYIGWLILVVSIWFGLGGLVNFGYRQIKNF